MELKILENQIEILKKEQDKYTNFCGTGENAFKVLELSKGIAELIDLKHKIKKERAVCPYNIEEGHEIDNFKEYLKREEKELEKIIFEIESKGDKATIGEQSMQYEAKEAIATIGRLEQRIKSFKDRKREIKKHIGR